MKYLVFAICCLTLAYAEEEKLGLQRLLNGRNGPNGRNGRSGQRAAQSAPTNNARLPATNGFSRSAAQTNSARQTRAGVPQNVAAAQFRGTVNPSNLVGQYAAVSNPTNYRAANVVGLNGGYNAAFAAQAQYGRSPVPFANNQFYGNSFIGRQALAGVSPFAGFEANPAIVTMARQVAASNGPNIPWSQIVQEKIDNEAMLGLQPFLGQRSVFGNNPGVTPLIAQQPLLGRQMFGGGLYGYGQFNAALPYTQQTSYRPTSSATAGQQLFGRAPVPGYNPFFGARRK